ncbi:MAG TPA: antitoxin [bacterium]|nr:antitoxin [bacterium]
MKAFDKQEKELMRSVEDGEWISDANNTAEIRKAAQVARNTFTKDRRMNIRIASRDLYLLKLKAFENGMPYQTLVSSIIHKYLNGVLEEK